MPEPTPTLANPTPEPPIDATQYSTAVRNRIQELHNDIGKMEQERIQLVGQLELLSLIPEETLITPPRSDVNGNG